MFLDKVQTYITIKGSTTPIVISALKQDKMTVDRLTKESHIFAAHNDCIYSLHYRICTAHQRSRLVGSRFRLHSQEI